MIKDKTLYDLQNLVRKLVSDKNSIDDVRSFLLQLIFCFYCEESGIFLGKPFTQLVLSSEASSFPPRFMQLIASLPPFMAKPQQLFLSEDTHHAIKKLCRISWNDVNPSIMGAVHQAALSRSDQRATGTHYTSLRNVHRVIDKLLIDKLLDQFSETKSAEEIAVLYEQLGKISVFDPACGGGNFLIESYLGLSAMRLIASRGISSVKPLSTKNFHGLELSEEAACICRTALFATARLEEKRYAEQFKTPLSPVDLSECGDIRCIDALNFDWDKISADYIVGNPPFMFNHKEQSFSQTLLFADSASASVDYSAGWIIKAAQYCAAHPRTECAFLTTNSVCQGSQVQFIWEPVTDKYKMHINWAYKSFRWVSDISNSKIDLSCVITAFSAKDMPDKQLMTVSDDGHDSARTVSHINAYLTEYDDIYLYPEGLDDRRPTMLLRRRTETPILTRYQAEQRTESGLLTCRFITAHNMLATTMRQYVVTDGGYSNSIVIPRHSSEKRKYVPLIYCKERVMVNDSVYIIPNTDLFVFGLLSSSMHNAWVRMFCGRLDMRIRYSNILCYKNFPFPEDITTEQKENIARLAARVLELRMNYKDQPLGNVYNDLPPELLLAHINLDKAVEKLYGEQLFFNDDGRLKVLIKLFNKQRTDRP